MDSATNDDAREAQSLDSAIKVPDGGLQAWLQVVGCFFCWFNTWYARFLSRGVRLAYMTCSTDTHQGPHERFLRFRSLLPNSPAFPDI
jgi:hypothetical protein